MLGYSYFRLVHRISAVLEKQKQSSQIAVTSRHVNGCLSVVRGEIRTGAGFKEHQSASVTVGNASRDVERCLAQFSTPHVNFGTITEKSFNDRRLRTFHRYVQRRIVVVRRRIYLDSFESKKKIK